MAASKPRILVILTSADKVPKNGKPIGWYLPELAHPFHVLRGKADLTFASPKGGEAPLDQASVDMSRDDPVCKDFLENHSSNWKQTQKLSDLADRASDFDAVFYPGGHGPMFDLVSDPDSLRILRDLHSQNKVISAVCHGPAALINAKTAYGEYIIKGRGVTGFDDAGEEMFGYTNDMDFSLERRLNENSGGKYSKSADGPLGEKVIVDGKLITGQNPASAYGVGHELAKALGI
ncbi:class I glutamine amidotransferase-like protein [Ilyonectria sp. MPI-CAGE-AT-0026]|nr:class I glutamine amidotransferase-like protein [Ilyonectria sp. MPI-CAGE-AT-0026]